MSLTPLQNVQMQFSAVQLGYNKEAKSNKAHKAVQAKSWVCTIHLAVHLQGQQWGTADWTGSELLASLPVASA